MIASTASVELLERAIGYTRSALEAAAHADVRSATPCAGWSLGQLIDHMADGLDAFTEASRGVVRLDPVPSLGVPLVDLRTKACALLGAWSAAADQRAPAPGRAVPADRGLAVADSGVAVAGLRLDADVLLHAAALEIAVHGWDVAATLRPCAVLPDPLARALTPAASLLLAEHDRAGRFAPALPSPPSAPEGVRLLRGLGRDVS